MTETDIAEEALPSTAPAADLAAAAEAMRASGETLIEQGGAQIAEADAKLAQILERLAAERAAAEAEHRRETSAGQRTKSGGEDRVRRSEWLDNAAAERERVAGAQAALEALEAERAALLGHLAGIGKRLERLAEDRRELAGQHQAALDAEDLAEVAALNARIGAGEDLAARLEGERTTAQGRLTAIGDGEGLGELRDLRSQVGLGSVERMLRDVWPQSPEAQAWRARTELAAIVTGNMQRIAEERHAAQQPQPPNYVHI